MTTPAERPSPEIRALVKALMVECRDDGANLRSSASTRAIAARRKLLAALGAMEEDKQRLDFITSGHKLEHEASNGYWYVLGTPQVCRDKDARVAIDTALNAGGSSNGRR